MKKHKKQRMLALILCAAVAVGVNVRANAAGFTGDANDIFTLTDTPAATYTGRLEAANIIKNIAFTDIDNDAIKEAAVRSGALNIIKGYNTKYTLGNIVTNEEAIALAIRVAGQDSEATELGLAITGATARKTLASDWAAGYLSLASSNGILTAGEYAFLSQPQATAAPDAIPTQTPTNVFYPKDPVTRERAIFALYTAITSAGGTFSTSPSLQAMYNYSDWENIAAKYARAIDTFTLNGIISPNSKGNFDPKGNLSRSDMALIIKKLGKIALPLNGMNLKNGSVGAIRDENVFSNGSNDLTRTAYIRTAAGEIETAKYPINETSAYGITDYDTVVYKNGSVGGIELLAEGDTVEYIYGGGIIYYIDVTGSEEVQTFQGKLQSVDESKRTLTLTKLDGKTYTFAIAEQLLGSINGETALLLDQNKVSMERIPLGKLAYGSTFTVKAVNNVVTEVSYVGEPVVIEEVKGIVIENDPDFGYMTILNNEGKLVTKNYYENDMEVRKIQHYDTGDDLGYIAHIFPNFQYDKRVTNIADIEPGDIVFLRFSADDKEVISNVSAATNYTSRYGKILRNVPGDDFSSIMIEYENKATAWFDYPNSIFATKSGKPVSASTLRAGDWVKLLVNEAIIEPGYVLETVKEITADAAGHEVDTIIKGSLMGIDSIQNQMTVQNAQTLAKTGWTNYKNLSKLNLSPDAEYYNGNNRISLDAAVKYFKRGGSTVYIALENTYSGEKVERVTFRDGRDSLLNSDFVLDSDGTKFTTYSSADGVATDSGTIVVRNGRLVSTDDIVPADYVRVALNGTDAAVVTIEDAPSTAGIQIVRGRILSVDDNVSFKVQSMSVLSGMEWVYTPIQREFAIDYDTKFISAAGITNMDNFLGYTTDTVINKVFTIVTDGSRASYVVDAPFVTTAVRGTIYQVNDTNLLIKDATYYVPDTGRWMRVSDTNNTLTVATAVNTIIGKNDKVTTTASLVNGDQIIAYTDSITTPVVPGATINSFITLVEK